VRLRKPIDCCGDALGNGLACFRFNGNSCPDHRSKIVGELRIEPIALDAL
jgi:hypothetical protein